MRFQNMLPNDPNYERAKINYHQINQALQHQYNIDPALLESVISDASKVESECYKADVDTWLFQLLKPELLKKLTPEAFTNCLRSSDLRKQHLPDDPATNWRLGIMFHETVFSAPLNPSKGLLYYFKAANAYAKQCLDAHNPYLRDLQRMLGGNWNIEYIFRQMMLLNPADCHDFLLILRNNTQNHIATALTSHSQKSEEKDNIYSAIFDQVLAVQNPEGADHLDHYLLAQINNHIATHEKYNPLEWLQQPIQWAEERLSISISMVQNSQINDVDTVICHTQALTIFRETHERLIAILFERILTAVPADLYKKNLETLINNAAKKIQDFIEALHKKKIFDTFMSNEAFATKLDTCSYLATQVNALFDYLENISKEDANNHYQALLDAFQIGQIHQLSQKSLEMILSHLSNEDFASLYKICDQAELKTFIQDEYEYRAALSYLQTAQALANKSTGDKIQEDRKKHNEEFVRSLQKTLQGKQNPLALQLAKGVTAYAELAMQEIEIAASQIGVERDHTLVQIKFLINQIEPLAQAFSNSKRIAALQQSRYYVQYLNARYDLLDTGKADSLIHFIKETTQDPQAASYRIDAIHSLIKNFCRSPHVKHVIVQKENIDIIEAYLEYAKEHNEIEIAQQLAILTLYETSVRLRGEHKYLSDENIQFCYQYCHQHITDPTIQAFEHTYDGQCAVYRYQKRHMGVSVHRINIIYHFAMALAGGCKQTFILDTCKTSIAYLFKNNNSNISNVIFPFDMNYILENSSKYLLQDERQTLLTVIADESKGFSALLESLMTPSTKKPYQIANDTLLQERNAKVQGELRYRGKSEERKKTDDYDANLQEPLKKPGVETRFFPNGFSFKGTLHSIGEIGQNLHNRVTPHSPRPGSKKRE